MVDLAGVRPGQPRATRDDTDTGRAQGLGRVDRRDRRDGGMYAGQHGGEVDLDPLDVDPVPGSPAGVGGGVRGREQRLARDTPGPQAVAAGPLALDQQHARAQACGRFRPDDARGAAADHQQIPHLPVRRGQVLGAHRLAGRDRVPTATWMCPPFTISCIGSSVLASSRFHGAR